MSRLTHDGRTGLGLWLPDGKRIAYARAEPGGKEAIIVRPIDGVGGEREIARAENPVFVTGVTPDGRHVVYGDFGRRKGRLYLAAVDGAAPVREIAAEGDGYEMCGIVSADGAWLAYVTNKTRREEICVRRVDGRGGSWQITNTQGGGVRWGRDARELFVITGETLMSVALATRGDTVSIAATTPLFEVPTSPVEQTLRDYDYDPLHDRFLFSHPPSGVSDRREIAVSVGWARRLAGTP
jgi:Tol biopolymer transport system component